MKQNVIIEGDSLEVLKDIQTESIDIIITSPPYNAAHNYDNYDDNRKFDEYLKNMTDIFSETYRVLKTGGRICVNVPFAIKNKETKHVTFISHHIAGILNNIGFSDFEWITWHKGKSMNHFQGNNTAWGSWKSPSCPSFRPLGEAVMVFYKGNRKHSGNKNNIDITAEEFKKWTKNTWYFNEDENCIYENLICVSNDAKKTDHPAPFPVELVERLLKLYSYEGETVLDPFNGIGTTTFAAEKFNRKYIGIDLSKKYCDIAKSRLSSGEKIVINNDTSSLVNSSANKDTLNLVFPYKESFSPNLVPYLIERYNVKKHDSLLDPFLGTGSVFINNLINKCYGYDTSPLAIEISKSKIVKLTPYEIKRGKDLVKSFNESNIVHHEYPKWKPYEKYATKDKFNLVMSFIDFFSMESDNLNRFTKYVVISNLDKIFDYKRDGNGIKFRKSRFDKNEAMVLLKELLITAYRLKSRFDKNNIKAFSFINESIVKEGNKNKKVDLVVTSPPYANMFDYFEVYKMELWTSGLMENNDDWRLLKKSALRSNKNAEIVKNEIIDNSILNITSKRLKETNVNSSTISMVNNYFYDMKIVLQKMYDLLHKECYMFIIVGNSFYGGIPVATDEILIEEAKKMGFDFIDLIVSRRLSTSPQQMKYISKDDRAYLRESIIVLRKEQK